MSYENVPCCDDCWWDVDNENHPTLNGRGVTFDEDESAEMIRWPFRFTQRIRPLEVCHFCGFETYSGIYIRTNVTETPAAERQFRDADIFPAEEDTRD